MQPSSPHRTRRYTPPQEDGLNDDRVLMATAAAHMRRTPSVVSPNLFTFEDHFAFEAVIGRSPLSEVYRARHRVTGELFAVKRSMRRFRSKADRSRCLHEIQAVASLPAHPNVIGQYRAWQQRGHLFIQMDLAEHGSLGSLIRQESEAGHVCREEMVWQVLWEAAQGLEFLHSHGIIVMDIKPDNLFRNRSGTFQIGDFGLAITSSLDEDWEEGDGEYVAPELLHADKPTPAADVYSLGATVYECATGRKLPRGAEEREAGLELPGRLPALRLLLRWMLADVPEARPSAAELVRQVGGMHLPFKLSAPAYCSGDAGPDTAGVGTPTTPAACRPGGPAHTDTLSGAPSTGTLSALPRRLGLRRLSSLALSDAAARTPGGCASPGGAATPHACGGGGAGLFWKRHARQGSDAMSVDDADAELESLRSGSPGGFRRLSVSSPVPTSPLSDFDCGLGTPAVPQRPRTATPGFSGSTAFVQHSRWAREDDWDCAQALPQVSAFPDLARSASLGARERRPGGAALSPDHPMALAEDIAPDDEPDILRLDDDADVAAGEGTAAAGCGGAPAARGRRPQWPCPVMSPFALSQPDAQQAERPEGGCPAAALQPQDRQGSSALSALPSLTLGGASWQERVRSSTPAATPLHAWQHHQQGAHELSSQQQLSGAGGLARNLPPAIVRSGGSPAGGDAAPSVKRRSEAWPQGILSSMFRGALRSGSLSACSMEQDDLAATRRELSLKNSLSLNMDQMVST